MERRSFIRNSALCAIAVSTNGFIQFNGQHYEGDCETTTDILGPFYRPDAPLRTDMRIANAAGQKIILSGQVMHKDCKTPLKNACVELWHCDANGVYDNESADFKYRAKAYCDEKGNYSFKTIFPVPYDVGDGNTRPAHFHMMITAEGYQAMITQLYFTGDKYIAKDGSASLPAAKKRILSLKDIAGGEKSVVFNVTMLEKIPADISVINRLAGVYTRGDGDKKVEFYRRDNLLWVKDKESINGGYPLEYIGNNVFEYYGWTSKYHFGIQGDGSVKLTFSGSGWDNKPEAWEAVKAKS
jgi:protocatechuate 3,4-dioxygenase beta subunit